MRESLTRVGVYAVLAGERRGADPRLIAMKLWAETQVIRECLRNMRKHRLVTESGARHAYRQTRFVMTPAGCQAANYELQRLSELVNLLDGQELAYDRALTVPNYTQLRVCAMLLAQGQVSAPEIVRETGACQAGIWCELKRMSEAGLVRLASVKSGRLVYELTPKGRREAAGPVLYSRRLLKMAGLRA